MVARETAQFFEPIAPNDALRDSRAPVWPDKSALEGGVVRGNKS
jgi:hypothetical protein